MSTSGLPCRGTATATRSARRGHRGRRFDDRATLLKHDLRGRAPPSEHDFGHGASRASSCSCRPTGATRRGRRLAHGLRVRPRHRHGRLRDPRRARRRRATPVATVDLPVRVPLGFHGNWIPDRAPRGSAATRIGSPAHARSGAGRRVRRAGADDPVVREFGDEVEVVLIDQGDGFVFGFSKLDVMFGRARPDGGRATRTATSSSPACASCRRRSARSTRPPSGSRPTPAPSRRTSWSSRSAPTCDPDATPGLRRGRPRVLHGGRRLRAPRRAGRLRAAAG